MTAEYLEMGSRNKKTGKLSYYVVKRDVATGKCKCECPAQEFRPWSDCKHIKRLKEKMRWDIG